MKPKSREWECLSVLVVEKLGLLWRFVPISWTQFCSVLITSLFKLTAAALQNSPSFLGCSLGKWIVNPCFNTNGLQKEFCLGIRQQISMFTLFTVILYPLCPINVAVILSYRQINTFVWLSLGGWMILHSRKYQRLKAVTLILLFFLSKICLCGYNSSFYYSLISVFLFLKDNQNK